MSKKPIVLAIFCTCLATGTLSAANEVNLKTPPTPIQSVTPTNTQLTRVDINQADVDSLMTLHGLAQQKAQAIVTYRQSHGQFKSLSELTQVKGIGDKLLQKLKENNQGRLICQPIQALT